LVDFLNKHKKLLYILLSVYWLIIFTLTTLPGKDLPETGISDKIEHFSAYLILGVLLSLALLFQNRFFRIKKYFAACSLIIIGIYAAFDEIHQIFVPGRDCEFLDWTSDMAGAIIGVIFIIFLIRIFQYTYNSN
jgi:VanZ family protein